MTTSSLATEAGMRRVALAWTALCVVMGIVIAVATLQLRDTGDALDNAAGALERTGRTIAAFDALPLVGDGVEAAGDRIARQGERAGEAADAARTRITIVAIGGGLLVALLGSVPVLLLWRVVAALEQSAGAAVADRRP